MHPAAGPRRPRPSSRLLAGLVLLVLAGLWLVACDGCEEGELPAMDAGGERAPLRLADLPSPQEARGMRLDALSRLYQNAARQAAEHEATVQGVRWNRGAADLARVLALRQDGEDGQGGQVGDDGDRWLARARDHLTEAARRKALEGACEAAVELARLEAADAGRLETAYAVAYRASRRFAEQRTEHASCLVEARRLTDILAPHRPGPELLAAIDADPDADDPTAGLEPTGVQEADVAVWASGRDDLGDATLTGVEVYGAPDPPDPGSEGVVRVALYFDRVAVFERGELPAEGELPRRLYLDFAEADIGEEVPRNVPIGGGGLERVRVAPFEPGVTRVVLDLSRDARHQTFFFTDPYRVVIDVERGPRPSASSEPRADATEARRLRTLVLDPGHGGNEYGARHDGLRESHLTLDLAQRVQALLAERLPETRVLLTRHGDEVVSLEQRVAFANAAGADAFISIHLNAADDPVEHGGVVTFVLDDTNDRQAIRLAARENQTSTAEVSGLQRILAQLHRTGQVGRSRELARVIQIGTLAGGRRVLPDLPDRGVKSGMFYVLVGARMPAVLLEASFLTQPEEHRALRTERYRQALAEGVAEGIVRYARGE